MIKANEILNVLVVREDRSIVQGLEQELPFNYKILAAQKGTEARDRLARDAFQIMICYEQLPDTTGIALLSEARKLYPHVVRILVSDKTSAKDVIDAIDRASIFKYLVDPEISDFGKALDDATDYYLSKTGGMYTDSLTQLRSNEVIVDMLEMELHRSRRYDGDFSAILLQVLSTDGTNNPSSVLMDPYLLKDVADILQAELRTSDVAGRLNDNCCLILLNNANRQGVEIFSNRLLKNIEQLKSEYDSELGTFDVRVSTYSLNGEKNMTSEAIIERLQEI